MGKRVPPKLMPVIRAVLVRLGPKCVYYKRRQGFHCLVFGGIKLGYVFEAYQDTTADEWIRDINNILDRWSTL